jgi:hypothetical protein
LNTVLGALTGLILSVAYLLYQKYFFSPVAAPQENREHIAAPASGKPVKADASKADSESAEANFRFSDYSERVFVDKTGLYRKDQLRKSLKSGVWVKNVKQPYSWNLSPTGRPAASLLTRSIGREQNHYI